MPLFDDTELTDLLNDADQALYLIADKAEQDALFSRSKVVQDQTPIVYALKRAVAWGVTLNISDDPFNHLAAYLKHKISGLSLMATTSLRILQHPSSSTIDAGDAVTFTVVAAGTAPLTYQWKKDDVNISGATSSTYTISYVIGGDAGSYTCVVSDATSSTVTSNAAVLSVNSVVTIQYGWYLTNPLADVEAGNPITYNTTTTIADGASISMTIPGTAADNHYFLTKEPVSQPIKAVWTNTVLNSGTIPDSVYLSPIIVGSYRYYLTRVPASMDTNENLILSV